MVPPIHPSARAASRSRQGALSPRLVLALIALVPQIALAHGPGPRRSAARQIQAGDLVGPPVPVPLDPSFVNWEPPHVSPLALTPDGQRLLAVNTPDNRLEVFELDPNRPIHLGSIPVGLDPVTVRARTSSEAWVVNHISDDVSIVDLTTMNVVKTFRTDDEPCDVVFAGSPQRAYLTCSQANTILVVNPANVSAPIQDFAALPGGGQTPIPQDVTLRLRIVGEDPRMLAVSPDGSLVYAAIFHSGNNTTILAGGALGVFTIPNVVNDTLSPYFNPDLPFQLGVNPPNPPPNDGAAFNPPIGTSLPPPPRVGLIVRRSITGQWVDDNAHDWTHLVSGADAAHSGRPVGWDLADHDVGIINTSTLSLSYRRALMNTCMALSVHPASGDVSVVGTEATNETRFEPNLNGRFIRVNFARFSPISPVAQPVEDLNPHLAYIPGPDFTPIPQLDRDRSIGDPRGVAWKSDGTRGYVTGMGSNNVVVIDATGHRATARPITVGEGPTGVVVDEARGRVYVLNKFAASISTISLATNIEQLPRATFFDPSPPAVKIGRKHLYDTHRNSGLGQASCASCHLDGRLDMLAWDLGNPRGEMEPFDQNCNGDPGGACQDWHPMKGPMTTQTLQDIIGKEPHHWRGDRDGIEEFAGAFNGLLGDDQPLPDSDMQEFENFLATIAIPPNPFRNFDNSLPARLPLTGHFSDGRFAGSGGLQFGDPMPPGNAQFGLLLYRAAGLDGVNCVTCHSLPTGAGPDVFFTDLGAGIFDPVPVGPNGEHHLMITSADGSTNRSIKIPHLRNQYEKTGLDFTQTLNTSGFGFIHDGSVDSIVRFISLPAFGFLNDQGIADVTALMLAFSGSDFGPPLPPPILPEPPGVASLDTHAAVGWQTTIIDSSSPQPGQLTLISNMLAQADLGKVGVVVKGRQAGLARGYSYLQGTGNLQSDRAAEVVSATVLKAAALAGSELTWTVVPLGTQTRIGIDRDLDGYFDRDELDNCSDPADPASVPTLRGDVNADGVVNLDDIDPFVTGLTHPELDPYEPLRADLNCDDQADGLDIQKFVARLLTGI